MAVETRAAGGRKERTKAMRRTRPLTLFTALLLSLVALLLTGSAEGAAVPSPAIVKVTFNKKLKKSILVDGRGFTLYLFGPDLHGKPTCTNDPSYHCSKAWPPLRTNGAPHAGRGAKQSLLGVVKNPDGGVQVTSNGHPLSTDGGSRDLGLVGDKKPGDVHGQGFGGLWSVVSPRGTRIF
jgi:predicted lipoprotein with Yx(FWY)xxD motif